MAFDRKWIFDKVNFYLKQENRFFASSEILLILGVDAQRRIAEDISYPKTNFSSFLTSGQYTTSTPSDFIKIDETSNPTFEDTGGIVDLEDVRKTSVGRANILEATANTPTNYFMENETTIGVYPKSTSGCLVVPYVKEPTSLSSDSSTNEITNQAYMAAVYWTVAEAFDKDNDQTRANKFRGYYEAERARLRRRYGDMFEVDKDIFPDERYTGQE